MLLIFHLLEREYSSVISSSMVLQGLCRSKIKKLWLALGLSPTAVLLLFPCFLTKSVRQRKMKKQKVTVTITGRNSTNRKPKKAEGC